MRKKTILKGASVLLIAALMIVSSVVVVADTDNETPVAITNLGATNYFVEKSIIEQPQKISLESPEAPQTVGNRGLLWDNGDPDFVNGLCCQRIGAVPVADTADDFTLDAETTIESVVWESVDDATYVWDGTDDLIIYEYTGTGPGAELVTRLQITNTREYLGEQFTRPWYRYTIDLIGQGAEITLPAGTYYLLLRPYSAGSVGQSFWLTSPAPPESLSSIYFRSAHFGYPDWVQGIVVFGADHDVNFKLYGPGGGPDDVIYDNNMDYTGLGASQYGETGGFDAYCADDFILDAPYTTVEDVHWVGGYWNTDYQTGAFDWGISFFEDDGTGTAPDGHPDTPSFAGPYYFAWEDIDKTLIEDSGTSIYYEMIVDLPEHLYFTAGEKYWIAIWGIGETMPQSGWGYHLDPILLHQSVFGSDYFGFAFWTDSVDVFGDPHDQCFMLTGSDEEPPATPDLDCDGVLNWEKIKPGTVVTGEITVENIGDPESLLDWEVESYPEWGTWTFDPESGTDLTPEDGVITITVEVTAPEEYEQGEEFTGEIKLVNSGDPGDFCIIDATMTNPVSHPILELLAQRFPMLVLILELLF